LANHAGVIGLEYLIGENEQSIKKRCRSRFSQLRYISNKMMFIYIYSPF